MLQLLDVGEFGQAIAGLDWLALDGLESRSTEIRQLARSVNASWHYLWEHENEHEQYVAFASKSDSKKRPTAAAALLRAAIQDTTFLSLITVGQEQYWVFAQSEGLPVKRMDFVGTAHDAMHLVRDFVSAQHKAPQLPVYTDEPALFLDLPFSIDPRSMSLEILGHSIKKADFGKAAFKRYSSISVPAVATTLALLIGVSGYTVYESHAQTQRAQAAAQANAIAEAQRREQLLADIQTGINKGLPTAALSEYTRTLHTLPMSVAGWHFSEATCASSHCVVSYSAQPLATWQGYIRAKPVDWPEPELSSDVNRLSQAIPIPVENTVTRKSEQLLDRSTAHFQIGNLAQMARVLDLSLQTPDHWEPVAVSTGSGTEGIDIPVSSTFTATGPAVLLQDFVRRLPNSTGITEIIFSKKEKIIFSLTGVVYARP